MKDLLIREIRIHKLRGPLQRRFGWSLNWTDHRVGTLVEVITEGGLRGWGDGEFGGTALTDSPELVIGRTPLEVQGIFESLRVPTTRQRRRGESLAGGLDVALWDVMGQALGMPVCRLLGQVHRMRVRPYCTALYRQDWPDLAQGLAEEALGWKRQGFSVMKLKIGYGVDVDIANVSAVREAIGDDVGLAVDSNCAYDVGTAIALARQLESFNLLWWEEPLLASDLAGYAELRRSIRIPLAAGETSGTDELIRDFIQPHLVDIVQPEIELIGFTGGSRVAYSCWLNHVRLVPHNWSTALRTAAILHWMATVQPLTEGLYTNEMLFELDSTEHPFRDRVLAEPLLRDAEGFMTVPDGPGLGVRVNEDAVAEFRTELLTIR